MKVLEKHYDKVHCHGTPIQEDFQRVVKHDEDGNEFIVYEKVDYKKILESNGRVSDWSLSNLLKAGINPDFPIHTGFNSRLEGIDVLNDAISDIYEVIDSETNNEKE